MRCDNIQRGLIAIREIVGADTAPGHRCSTLDQQLKNFPESTGDQRIKLAKAMREAHDYLATSTELVTGDRHQ